VASFLALLSGIAFCVCAGGAQADIVYEFTGTCTRVRDFNAESGNPEPPCSALTTAISTASIRMPMTIGPDSRRHVAIAVLGLASSR